MGNISKIIIAFMIGLITGYCLLWYGGFTISKPDYKKFDINLFQNNKDNKALIRLERGRCYNKNYKEFLNTKVPPYLREFLGQPIDMNDLKSDIDTIFKNGNTTSLRCYTVINADSTPFISKVLIGIEKNSSSENQCRKNIYRITSSTGGVRNVEADISDTHKPCTPQPCDDL